MRQKRVKRSLIHRFFLEKFGFFNIYLKSEGGNLLLVKCLDFSVRGVRVLSVNRAILRNEKFSVVLKDLNEVRTSLARVDTIQKIVFGEKVYYFANLKFLEITNAAVEEISNFFVIQAKMKIAIFREKNAQIILIIFSILLIFGIMALFVLKKWK